MNSIRIEAKALAQRWELPPGKKQVVVDSLLSVLEDKEATNRDKATAAKALITAEGQNQKDDHAKLQQDGNRFAAMLAHLRAHGNLEDFTEGTTGGSAIGIGEET